MVDKYLFRTPKVVPENRIIVHNHVMPQRELGTEGFRAWLADRNATEYQVEVCPCGWAPHLREHYRVKRL